MAETGSKIFDLDALTDIADDDVLVEVDVSDTTDSVDGTNKKITVRDLLGLLNNGWIPAEQTWEYLSGTTITVPTGAADIYRKGMPFKLTANSVELQGYIVGIADTVLTIVGDTLTNHTFTENYYSNTGNPFGFPSYFDYTPSYSADATMTFTSISTRAARFSISGRTVYLNLDFTGTTGGTASTAVFATLPVPAEDSYNRQSCPIGDGANKLGWAYAADATKVGFFNETQSNWGLGASRYCFLSNSYIMA